MSPVTFRTLTTGALVASLAVAVACDTQAGEDYQGETLASLHGMVTSDLDEPPAGLEAVLVWETITGEPDFVTGESVAVTGGFPSSYRIDLLVPPDDLVLNDFTEGSAPQETRFGVAPLMALPAGEELGEFAANAVGVSERYMLVYAEGDVAEGSVTATLLGGPLDAGFHLMEVIDNSDPTCAGEEGLDCLRPAPDGFDTSVDVRLDEHDLLDIPEWT